MGIPRFASRISCHGSVGVIGRRGEPRKDHAIIDGPSLAHALLQQVSGAAVKSDGGIAPLYSYSALGKAAIAWLENLQAHGFVIEAIYFDGALPEHKKEIRSERLQAYIDKLVVFRAVHDDIAKASKNSRSTASPEQTKRRIEIAHRSLPPPPFLVFAVIEALRDSHYACRTFVVNGEADEFCAAKAMEMSHGVSSSQTSIFTNDSDLVIYGLGEHVRVVQINEMSNDEGAVTSLQFWPQHLRNLDGSEERRALIRPAYLMKLDPHLSFRNALTQSKKHVSLYLDDDFKAFARTYDLTEARANLSELAEEVASGYHKSRLVDSRISEILHQAIQERDRIRESKTWYATKNARAIEQTKADLANGWSHIGPRSERANAARQAEQDSKSAPGMDFDIRDFAYDPEEEDLKPADFDLFLPVLFEDTTRATAWKAGVLLREVAMHLATRLCGTSTTVYEHKRSGQRVRATSCEQISDEICNQRLAEWHRDWAGELEKLSTLGDAYRWKFLIMRLLLADIIREEVPLPTKDAVMSTISNAPALTWDSAHFSAQYQAEYYSIRMLKQVLGFLNRLDSENGHNSEVCEQALAILDDFPSIAAFCDREVDDDERRTTALEAAVERLCSESGVPDQPRPKATSSKGGGGGRKKRKVGEQPRNVFSSLEDAEEA